MARIKNEGEKNPFEAKMEEVSQRSAQEILSEYKRILVKNKDFTNAALIGKLMIQLALTLPIAKSRIAFDELNSAEPGITVEKSFRK
ncbi:MAG TPA: hypothetical protein VI819_02065 [Patescibacteria group bacterium]|nr:hypothetical protein [Patescibacteria group bacterium]